MFDAVADLLAFIDASPTPWHAVRQAELRLRAAGYRALDEGDAWELAVGDKVFVTRGGSSLAAFEIGSVLPSQGGFRILGAHTDSPNLRLKPRPVAGASGTHVLAVEPYGSPLWHTWIDRDLALAGRVLLKGEPLRSVLVRFDRPMARVPSLAIHLQREVNVEGLILNPQQHLPALAALASGGPFDLAELLAQEIGGVSASEILGFDLCLHEAQPSARGGVRGELLFAPRLDNLASCHAGLIALTQARGPTPATRGIVLYDHEEVGSLSAQGASSTFLTDAIERVCASLDRGSQAYPRALSRSFVISADMGHAVHPNFADKHEPGHRPELGKGPILKTNVNQRYATDGESRARFVALCAAAEVVPQDFVVRSDLPCGTTIGPITAGRLGVRTVDVGNPMLSMHSCRELAAAADVAPMIAVLQRFFEDTKTP